MSFLTWHFNGIGSLLSCFLQTLVASFPSEAFPAESLPFVVSILHQEQLEFYPTMPPFWLAIGCIWNGFIATLHSNKMDFIRAAYDTTIFQYPNPTG